MRIAVINWVTNVLNRAASALNLSHRIREKRRVPRTKLGSPLAVLTTGNQTYRGVCRDISQCGLGAIVYGDLHVHQNVRLRFDAGGGAETNLRAVVRNHYGSRYGFEFVDPVDLRLEASRQD
ncbi:MAG: PilZ domain-containing protein [Acidobacteriia bacterium]|nr:PilZ domain-containing protein [Terriglobia bacterium]